MPRLFTAFSLPSMIGGQLSGLRGGLAHARWIDAEDYHITLCFIGDVPATLADDIDQALQHVTHPVVTLNLCGLGAFGSRRPRAVWAKVTVSDALLGLQAKLSHALRQIGAPIERRKYIPHVTIARLKYTSAKAVADYLNLRGGFESTCFTVQEFVLFSSRPGHGGGPYVVERRYPLVADDAGMDRPG